MKLRKCSPRLIYRKGNAEFLAWIGLDTERVEINQMIEDVIK
jgi:hypothetical protein